MFKLTLFLSIIAIGVASQTTPTKKCKNFEHHYPKKIVLKTPEGICTELPCFFVGGTNVTADVTFDVESEVTKIAAKINVINNGTTKDYPIPGGDEACKWLTNTACPVKKHTEINMRYVVPVKRILGSLTLDSYFLDQSKNVISCFELPVIVAI